MRGIGHLLRWLAGGLGLLFALLLATFGGLQTGVGQAWLAGALARLVSDPDFSVSIRGFSGGLGGLVPFRMAAERIEIADRDGIYLSLHDISLDISPAALFNGHVQIRSLRAAEIAMARPSAGPSTTPLIDYFRVPQLPVAVVLDRVAVGRLALAPPVLGESVVATFDGSAAVTGATARIGLDLHRIDGAGGNLALALELAGADPVLSLRLEASEPTGVLLDRLLGRDDHLPLALSIDGAGALADWHGRLTTTAGTLAHCDAELSLAAAAETVLGLSGTVAAAPLLPAELAPVLGDRVALSARATFGERIRLDPLSIEMAAGRLTGDAAFGGPGEAVAAHVRASLPDLSPLSLLAGEPLRGSATITVELSGSETRPALAASGRIEGLAPPELGRDIDWSLALVFDRAAGMAELTRLSAHGIGLDLTGSGQLADGGHAIDGRLRLTIADLRPFSGLVGGAIAGAVEIEADAARAGTDGLTARLTGSATGLRTGIAAADALLGGSVTVSGGLQRDEAGVLIVDRLALSASDLKLSGSGRFDPASDGLSAAATLELPRLKPLGSALGTELAGALSARLKADGALARLRLGGEIDGVEIAAAGAKIDRLRLAAEVADLATPRAVLDGSFRAGGLDGTVSLTAEPKGSAELDLPRLRLTAADSAIEGSLRIAFDSGLIRGSVSGRAPDLARWSRLAGTPLGGSLELNAGLDARAGQSLDLSVTGTRLVLGAARVGRLAVTTRLADIWRTPSGTGQVSLSGASFGAGDIATATARFESARPGRFTFQGDAKGRPLSFALAGEAGLEPGRSELRLTRLNGALGDDQIRLEQPLTLSQRGSDLAFSDLALTFGSGRVSGNGAVRGQALALTLNATDLPVASGARLFGYHRVRGSLTVGMRLDGTFAAPQGHLTLTARELAFALPKQARPPRLGLTVDGNWNGRELGLQGRVTGLEGDRIGFKGSVPLLLSRAPLGLSVPPQGRLALQVEGSGEVGHLADLLPLGEDRLSGRFAADVAVAGTVAAPAANGRLRLSQGRYQNFATGMVLTKLEADLVGDRDRFSVTSLSAADSAGGSLTAQGSVVLGGPSGPSADLSATLTNFRIAANDEALATASGTVAVSGPLASPKVTARLGVDRGEFNLPASLPPTVVVLKVTEIDRRTGRPPPPAAAGTPPALPAALDLKLDMPGRIFVRGHGLDSEWRGHLAITGTSAAPEIAGALEEIRGNIDLLGKNFTLTRGTIVFDGTAKLDPALDIVAEVTAADITAQVVISGFASAPKVTLTSTPLLPQDEVLARVLFNRATGQITAAEGLQLAQAAAALRGGGPGVLDRLRSGLGLDWFKLGSGPAGAASSILNPRATSTSAKGGTALSAGKYVAPGVSVGVTQGISPPTSKITVEIEVRPHVTVQTEVGQSGGSGIGLNYSYDY